MNLTDLIDRNLIPGPWAEGDNIPWNDPDFSERMLAEHLTQDHDAASRRFEIIDEQVHWIHDQILGQRPSRILDLACGPGLYASRLARLGHSLTGVDFSPASIRYARQQAGQAGQTIEYIESDLRALDYGSGYDLVLLIYGEFNVFRPADVELILAKAHHALKPGGTLLLEPQNLAFIQRVNNEPPIWRTHRKGLFSDRPHLVLQENFWDGRSLTVTTRYWVIDVATAEVSRYAMTTQGYTDESLVALLAGQGFEQCVFYPALAPKEDQPRQEFFGLAALKPVLK